MIEYKTQGLLERASEKDIPTGPMSPLLFMKEISKQIEQRFNGLIRIHFHDNEINQWYESKNKTELTGCDNLIFGARYENFIAIQFWIDIGVHAQPVFQCTADFPIDNIDLQSAKSYYERKFEKHLSKEDMMQLAVYCLNNYDEVFKIKLVENGIRKQGLLQD